MNKCPSRLSKIIFLMSEIEKNQEIAIKYVIYKYGNMCLKKHLEEFERGTIGKWTSGWKEPGRSLLFLAVCLIAVHFLSCTMNKIFNVVEIV